MSLNSIVGLWNDTSFGNQQTQWEKTHKHTRKTHISTRFKPFDRTDFMIQVKTKQNNYNIVCTMGILAATKLKSHPFVFMLVL